MQIKINDILKQEKAVSSEIEKLEKSIEEIKKSIIDISAGDKRVDNLRKGKILLEEITNIKQSLKDKCKFEEEIKDVRERKMILTDQFDKLKDTYNQTGGYNTRLKDDLKNTKYELGNSRYKDITKHLADLEVRCALAKLMTQEVSE